MARYGSTAGDAPSVLEEGGHVEVAALARRTALLGRRRPGVAARPPAATAEARRNYGHPDLPVQAVVDGRAEDDVRVVGRGRTDHLRCLVHLDERQVVASRNREEDA